MTRGDSLAPDNGSMRSGHHLPKPPVDRGPRARDHFDITTEYYVNQAAVPLGVALFGCACGAKRVECNLHGGSAPEGWSITADGSCLCPRCASANEPLKPGS